MANTYSRMYAQLVFAIKYRDALIMSDWEEELYKYITGIIQNKGQKMLCINGYVNHLHLLIGFKPDCCLSDLVRDVKTSSTEFVKLRGFTPFKFQWQEGFGAFTYSHSQLDGIIAYINGQKEHHRKVSFKDEYLTFLKDVEIEYDQRFLFDWLE